MLELFISSIIEYSIAILPWFVVGLVLAVIAEAKMSRKAIRRYLGKPGVGKLLGAQVLGMLSPLSIMSMVPMASELVGLGASPGLLFSFFIAERAYDTQAFLIVGNLFGVRMAILNMLGVLGALVVTAMYLNKKAVEFSKSERKHKGFWGRQIKLLGTVLVGIVVGALLRSLIPADWFGSVAGSYLGAIGSSLVTGFSLYFGPLMGNYPVAKAFAELGMAPIGVLTFLTVSPILNLVIMAIFSGMVGVRNTIKAVAIYSVAAMVLSVGLGMWL